MAKILIVEDNVPMGRTIRDWLIADGHTSELVHTGEEAGARIKLYSYDLLVFDLSLPDCDGLELLGKFRSTGGSTPVLILTGRNDPATGLDAGADDYLRKPFDPRELSARVRALLRRPQEAPQPVLKNGALELDIEKGILLKAGEKVQLLPKELALMELFMRHPERLFSADEIMNRVWSSESETSPEAIRVHINRLRSKIDIDGKPSHIVTVRGLGYKLAAE